METHGCSGLVVWYLVVVSVVRFVLCYFGSIILLLVVWLMIDSDRFWYMWHDVTSCGLLGTFAPKQSTTKERWPQDAEDLSQCLSQQQTLQRKEEEEIPTVHCHRCTDALCLHGSIHTAISVHPSMHASSWQRASKQIYGRMHQGLPGLTWIAWIALNCYWNVFILKFRYGNFIHFDEFHGSVSTRDQSVTQFQDNFRYNFAR